MNLKFYSKTVILIAYFAFSSFMTHAEQFDENPAIDFINGHHNNRLSAYNKNPNLKETSSYDHDTDAINNLLSNRNNVRKDVHASKLMKEEIIIAVIGEKITYFGSAESHSLKGSLDTNKVLLDKSDPLYGHFRVLELIDLISTSLINERIFYTDFDINSALNGVNQGFYNEIRRLSNIKKEQFSDCLKYARDRHMRGIDTYKAKVIDKQKISGGIKNAQTAKGAPIPALKATSATTSDTFSKHLILDPLPETGKIIYPENFGSIKRIDGIDVVVGVKPTKQYDGTNTDTYFKIEKINGIEERINYWRDWYRQTGEKSIRGVKDGGAFSESLELSSVKSSPFRIVPFLKPSQSIFVASVSSKYPLSRHPFTQQKEDKLDDEVVVSVLVEEGSHIISLMGINSSPVREYLSNNKIEYKPECKKGITPDLLSFIAYIFTTTNKYSDQRIMLATKPVGAMINILDKFPKGQMWRHGYNKQPSSLQSDFALQKEGSKQWKLMLDGSEITYTQPDIWSQHTCFGTAMYTYFVDAQMLHNKW